MALKKLVEDGTGNSVEYHIIERVELNQYNNRLSVDVTSFKDEHARTDRKLPPKSHGYKNIYKELPKEDQDIILGIFYKLIKKKPEWSDAEDC